MYLKLIITTYLLFNLYLMSISAQSKIERTFGGGGYAPDFASKIIECSDSNYLVAGYYSDSDKGSQYLLKLDQNGDTLWTQHHGESHSGVFSDILQIDTNNYLAVGNNIGKVFLLKFNINGDTSWTRHYEVGEGVGNELPYFIRTTDNEFIIVGSVFNFNDDANNIFAMKVNQAGDIQWNIIYERQKDQRAKSIVESTGSTFLIVGSNGDNNSSAHTSHYIMKINTLGDTLWTKTFGGGNFNIINSIISSSDGNFLITGEYISDDDGISDLFIGKIDQNGELIWSKLIGSNLDDKGECIAVTADGYYIITGRTLSKTDRDGYIYFVKIDEDGNVLSEKKYGGINSSIGKSILHSSDNHYCIVGEFNWDMYFLKLPMLYIESLAQKTTICGDSIQLNPHIEFFNDNSHIEYNWSPQQYFDNPTSDNPFVALPDSMYLKINITDGENFASDSVFVNVNPVVIEMANNRSMICGSSTKMSFSLNTESTDFKIKWTPAHSLSNDTIWHPYARPTESIMYKLLISKVECAANDSIFINVEEMQVSLGDDQHIDCGDSLQLDVTVNSSSPDHKYLWEPNWIFNNDTLRTPWVKLDTSTMVKVNVDYKTCHAEDSMTINILNPDYGLSFTVSNKLFTSPPFVAQFDNTSSQKDNLKFIWYFGDGDSLISNNETVFHEYSYNGLYDIIFVAIHEETGCLDTLIKSGLIYCTGGTDPTSYKSIHPMEKSMEIIPNPVHDKAFVHFPNPNHELYDIIIMDITGKIFKIRNNYSDKIIEFNRDGLPDGLYLIELRGPRIYRGKILIE